MTNGFDEKHKATAMHVGRDEYIKTISKLKQDGFEMCIDVTAVDYLQANERAELPDGIKEERFEIVVQLLSMSLRKRVRIRVQVPQENASIQTLFALYPGSEAMEREVYDLMGITFIDHPDMTRILMPEEWEGHPLRKDYDIASIPVRFSSDDVGAS